MHRRAFVVGLAQLAAGCVAGSTPSDPAPRPRSEPPPRTPSPPADPLQAAAAKLREAYADEGFTVLVERPFVVAGDEAPETVRHRATSTVAWATARLKQAYFDTDPPGPVTIWLFRDDASYRHWARTLYEHRPDTPYGYYSPDVNALLMNISTGGGTLVHELVHPFIDANFPTCPSWFDEGLASLYEQCGERDGRIVGFENWRLPGLQEALSTGTAPSFETLLHTSREAFYADETGVHYAQARYLCFYLQHRGLLRRYYHAFRDAASTDPSGYATLQTVLDRTDMKAFAAAWSDFVLGLRYG
ncbi:MAG: hypothetical protein AAGA54_12375 [Myxococcota bacterium]